MYPIILGLDEHRHFESTLHLLARLHPTDSVVHAVHAVETPPLFPGSLPLPAATGVTPWGSARTVVGTLHSRVVEEPA